MEIQIKLEGMFKQEGLVQYTRDFRAKLLRATRKAMQSVGKEVKEQIQNDVRAKMKVKRNAFVKSFTYKVYYQKTEKIPSLHFYSRVPWVGIHSKGYNQNKNIVIPFTKEAPKNLTRSNTLGFKTFKILLTTLKSHNNLFFDKSSGKTIIWAKNTKEDQALLIKFKSIRRKSIGVGYKKNERVNIGVVVKNSTFKKKLDMENIVNKSIPKLNKTIENIFKSL